MKTQTIFDEMVKMTTAMADGFTSLPKILVHIIKNLYDIEKRLEKIEGERKDG